MKNPNYRKPATSALKQVVKDAEPDEFLNPADFKSIQLTVLVKNATTRTEVPKDKKVVFVQFFEEAVELEVPLRTCSMGHSLLIEIEIAGTPKKTEKFEATGKVKQIKRTSDEMESIVLELVQFKNKNWENLKSLFTSRQTEIEEFLKATRGY